MLTYARDLPLPYREDSGEVGLDCGRVLAHGRTATERRPIGTACKLHQPTHRIFGDFLGLVIRVRSALAKILDGCHDHAGLESMHRIEPKPKTLHDPGREVLDQDVSIANQVRKDFPSFRRVDIERDALLSRVEPQKRDAPLPSLDSLVKGTDFAQAVAGPRFLNLDDFGTETSHQLGTERPGEVMGQVQYLQMR